MYAAEERPFNLIQQFDALNLDLSYIYLRIYLHTLVYVYLCCNRPFTLLSGRIYLSPALLLLAFYYKVLLRLHDYVDTMRARMFWLCIYGAKLLKNTNLTNKQLTVLPVASHDEKLYS